MSEAGEPGPVGASAPARRKLVGRCVCAAVRYRVTDRFRYSLNCHCSQCRQATGSAFKAFAGIEREEFEIVSGEAQLLRYGGPQHHDARCGRCGALLYSLVRAGAYVHVTLGTLLDTPGIRPSAHIFVGSKAPWFTITDTLPQHAGLPPRA
jgi:hypothetical protein